MNRECSGKNPDRKEKPFRNQKAICKKSEIQILYEFTRNSFFFKKRRKHIDKYYLKYLNHGRFISEMEWAPFKCLPWNINDSIANLTSKLTIANFEGC